MDDWNGKIRNNKLREKWKKQETEGKGEKIVRFWIQSQYRESVLSLFSYREGRPGKG